MKYLSDALFIISAFVWFYSSKVEIYPNNSANFSSNTKNNVQNNTRKVAKLNAIAAAITGVAAFLQIFS